MIELSAQPAAGANRYIKILGIGGAGANVLDRLALDGVNPCHLIAANTDAMALNASVAGEKLQLGRAATRGLGSGGDPDLGRVSTEEAASEIRSALQGVNCVFLLAGLGGGTGSGATPFIAEMAHEMGIWVVAIVTLPFGFEGKRRAQQASEALAALHAQADAVICFENDRMAGLVAPKAGIQQAFAEADRTMSQSVQSIVALLSREGLIHLGFDDLRAALDRPGGLCPCCLFGHGEADGANRCFDALARAFKSPLMDKGRALRECDTLLVQVSGGPDMTLNEVQLLMEEFNRSVNGQTRLLFGAVVVPELAGRMSVTVMGALPASDAVNLLAHTADTTVSNSRSPLRELAEREAQRVAALAEPETAAPLATTVVISGTPPEVENLPAEAPDAPLEIEAAPVEAESPETELVDPPAALDDAPWDDTPSVEVQAGEPEPVAAEADEPVAPSPEPELQPEAETAPVDEAPKPARRRSVDDRQASLFGDEPKPAEKPGALPASTKIARPIPGRTLQSGVARMPLRNAEPVAPPAPSTPVPAPEPVVPAALSTPAPVAIPATTRSGPVRQPVIPAAPAQPSGAPPAGPKSPQQETLQFEPVSRGRFDRSEPTIVDGQDLDVPTFMRQKVRIR